MGALPAAMLPYWVMAAPTAVVNPLTVAHDRSEMGCGAATGEGARGVPRMRRRGDAFSAFAKSNAISRTRPIEPHEAGAMKGRSMKRNIILFGATFALGFSVAAAPAQTLKAVKDRGSLICGVSQGLPGFSNPDDKGN